MYILDVTLAKAIDVAASDFSFLGMGGKSDPYVTFKVGSKTFKSSMVASTLNPVWNPPEKFRFKVDNPKESCLEIKIFDYDRFNADDLIGTRNIALAPFLEKRGSELISYDIDVPDQYAKQKRRSAVYLDIKLTSDDAVDLVLELYENQRYHIVKKWTYEPLMDGFSERRRWSSVQDSSVTSDSFEEVAPTVPSTHTTDGWTLDVSQGDENGWMYAVTFQGPWQKESFSLATVRRRKWVNKCKSKQAASSAA